MELSKILSAYHCRSAKVQALPPQHQEAREREAIKNDPRLTQLLGNEPILEIHKVEGGYVVATELHELRVDVHRLPPERHICGPANFELFFHQPVPKSCK